LDVELVINKFTLISLRNDCGLVVLTLLNVQPG